MTKIAPPPPIKGGPIETAIKEVLFLAIIVVLAYSLFTMMVLGWGGFLTNGSKGLDPIIKKLGTFSPFVLWAVYTVMHKGWARKLLAFIALVFCTSVLIFVVARTDPNSFASSIMQVIHKHYGI